MVPLLLVKGGDFLLMSTAARLVRRARFIVAAVSRSTKQRPLRPHTRELAASALPFA